jgi:hypothetical protein
MLGVSSSVMVPLRVDDWRVGEVGCLGEADGCGDCGSPCGLRLSAFFPPLPTLTTWARAGMAVAALALLRKVDPTLKVLPAGLFDLNFS